MAIFAAFVTLLLLTVTRDRCFNLLLQKNREDWLLDMSGLLVQGVVIPALQLLLVYQLYQWLLPAWKGGLELPLGLGFLLSFVFVDYLYYWNHRLLHHRFWPWHQVHHTVTQMDVLGTSRNTLWSSFFILYLWIHPLFLFLLQHPAGYVLGVTLTAILDLWRHSAIAPDPQSLIYCWLSPWLVLPQDHAWHHAQPQGCNYGANLKLWDQLHGTYYECDRAPEALGIETNLTLSQKLFWPF
ncbi:MULTISPECIES: sterol desaturase family protein [Trichocoleus]|uniref:Sterol desaturase family protein n=1 Tax=Trichocoleus desertorum GB2-A4 TaxID=2933944 RepID=A0ABV0J8M2_9CYAN|nr:sterol desaturase family protein [Trichocoleus sp. FACHB-46]MBD1862560.1 sterol desaturase family protein [Trichocoleus sp. FACHB-46]